MKENTKKEMISWAKSFIVAIILAFICRQFLFSPITVFGESMSPSFLDHDKVVISKTSKIQRFDVIVFDAPDIENEHYIKRVIGLPGDSIEVKNDVLYINGKAYKEPYLDENKRISPSNSLTEDFSLLEKTGKSKVPDNMLFVMGDNRLNSKDSRTFGLISYDSVIGEVKFRFYPLNEIGLPK
ncbi:signal peptidase I [Siminovitchia fortis]|uniref:Signal peptidase I n=1 Tax=Siminovitchia fortis TaxID=254758 RepID=A0A443ILV6_9BACI|nr:signal peptidase I [Siminovitchia fortis]RWR05976.1 signal peptidase I [Siminovitchia fortis]WHY82370.1 signal peptidase I [Siminovitchia fortis]